jgi:4-hydroxy-tetrahydrodipicolinate synthase
VVGVEVDTLVRLSRLPRIVGVKDATGDLSRPGRERVRIEKDFAWFSGEDATAVAYNASGGSGCISVTSNVAPAQCAAMQAACLNGDYQAALRYQDLLMPLHEALFAEASPAGVKYAVSRLGLCSETCRLPIIPLSEETRLRIDHAMERLTDAAPA